MKIPTRFNLWSIFLILSAAIILCGCKTGGAKQSLAHAESQTAESPQVIVVPVLILSSPDHNSSGDRWNPMPENNSRDRSTQVLKSEQTGAPAEL